MTWAELEATGGITEAAYREEVKTCSPYQACFNLYDQQVYVENPFFEAFEFELSRNKTTLLKGMLENELIYEDWYKQYRIDGSRVAASLTIDDAGISLEPVFNGEGFDAFGAPPSKEFLTAGDASLTTNQLFTFLEQTASINWVGMDCVEVAPAYDHAELTSNAAAQVVWTYLAGQVAKTSSFKD